MEQTKKWYQSKIVLFGGALVLVFGSNLLLGFLTGQGVSAEQVQAIEQAQPAVAEAVKKLQSGANILDVIGLVAGAVITVARVWFTTRLIPQSIGK